jgi:tryptophan halogenase
MEIPESLAHKINLFRNTGKIIREHDDLFSESSWLQVLVGQGIMPRDYHPLADGISEKDLLEMLANMRKIKQSPMSHLPSHDDFLKQVCAV